MATVLCLRSELRIASPLSPFQIKETMQKSDAATSGTTPRTQPLRRGHNVCETCFHRLRDTSSPCPICKSRFANIGIRNFGMEGLGPQCTVASKSALLSRLKILWTCLQKAVKTCTRGCLWLAVSWQKARSWEGDLRRPWRRLLGTGPASALLPIRPFLTANGSLAQPKANARASQSKVVSSRSTV